MTDFRHITDTSQTVFWHIFVTGSFLTNFRQIYDRFLKIVGPTHWYWVSRFWSSTGFHILRQTTLLTAWFCVKILYLCGRERLKYGRPLLRIDCCRRRRRRGRERPLWCGSCALSKVRDKQSSVRSGPEEREGEVGTRRSAFYTFTQGGPDRGSKW